MDVTPDTPQEIAYLQLASRGNRALRSAFRPLQADASTTAPREAPVLRTAGLARPRGIT